MDRDPARLHSSCGQLMRDSYAPRSGAELVWLMSQNDTGNVVKLWRKITIGVLVLLFFSWMMAASTTAEGDLAKLGQIAIGGLVMLSIVYGLIELIAWPLRAIFGKGKSTPD